MLAAVWLVSACSAAAPSGDRSPSLVPSSVQPTRLPDPASPGPSGSFDLPQSIIDPVVAEAARLAGVPVDQVTVVSAEAVTFPDGGLGCPVPGMSYTQVQVEGFKVVVDAGGARTTSAGPPGQVPPLREVRAADPTPKRRAGAQT